MKLSLLNYFIAAYEEKNITAAARRCHISQPSISNAIKELEQELETILFHREKRGITIAEDAHHLYPLALKVVQDAEKIPKLFSKEKETEHISISAFPYLSPSKLSNTLTKLNSEIGNLHITLVEDGTESDARITLDILKKDDEIFLPLWEEDYKICAPYSHPLSKYEIITPDELYKFDFIECPECEAHQQTIGLLACNGMKINKAATAETKAMVMYLVRAGIGVSFLPDGVLEMAPDLAVIPFDGPRMFRRIGICYKVNKTLAPTLNKVLQTLAK